MNPSILAEKRHFAHAGELQILQTVVYILCVDLWLREAKIFNVSFATFVGDKGGAKTLAHRRPSPRLCASSSTPPKFRSRLVGRPLRGRSFLFTPRGAPRPF